MLGQRESEPAEEPWLPAFASRAAPRGLAAAGRQGPFSGGRGSAHRCLAGPAPAGEAAGKRRLSAPFLRTAVESPVPAEPRAGTSPLLLPLSGWELGNCQNFSAPSSSSLLEWEGSLYLKKVLRSQLRDVNNLCVNSKQSQNTELIASSTLSLEWLAGLDLAVKSNAPSCVFPVWAEESA